MQTNDALALILGSSLSLLGIVFLVGLYRDYRRDLFRARLSALQDELFDRAAEGGIDIEHPAYGLLQDALQGFIQFGPRLGTLRLLLSALFLGSSDDRETCDFEARWRAASCTMDPEARIWLEDIRREMHRAFFRHLLATSFLGAFLVFLWLGRSSEEMAANRLDSVALAHAA